NSLSSRFCRRLRCVLPPILREPAESLGTRVQRDSRKEYNHSRELLDPAPCRGFQPVQPSHFWRRSCNRSDERQLRSSAAKQWPVEHPEAAPTRCAPKLLKPERNE